MSETDINISKTTIIGKDCVETFLPTSQSAGFAENGIKLAGLSELRDDYSIYRPDADFALLLYTLDGSGEVLLNGEKRPLATGSVIHLPRGSEHHYWISAENWRILWFHLGGGIVDAALRLGENPFILEMSPPAELEHLILACVRHAATLESDDESLHLYALLVKNAITRDFRGTLSDVDMEIANRFSALLAEIHSKPSKKWTISAMAAKTGLSEGHFQRLFKAWSGTTPMSKVFDARMRLAENLLNHSSPRLSEIAERLGYSDQFAFSKAYKRWSGHSPTTTP